ncbi:MAG TPA: nucleotide exchange factor GrpE [Casimicrobiaceae bacterium]|jgi:molecular chaperone GrpE
MTPNDPNSRESADIVPTKTGETVADSAPADPAPDLADLLKKAETEVADLRDAWLRARADAENTRKQAQADIAKTYKYAIEKFAEDLLPVKDALEQTLTAENITPETLKSGAELTLKALEAAFGRAQITEINPGGEKFDPHRHQAMMTIESREPPNTVVTVYQKGYLINDRTLRPALVAVAKPTAKPDESSPQTSTSAGDGSASKRR